VIRDLATPTPHPEPAKRPWWASYVLYASYGIVDVPVRPQAPPQLVERHWTPREVLALLAWLPDDSACAASVAGGRHYRGWGQDRWLRKYLFDAMQNNTVVNAKIAAGKKGRAVKAPKPYPGPEAQQRKVEASRPKITVANLPRMIGPKTTKDGD
jgi:hypothetical protein